NQIEGKSFPLSVIRIPKARTKVISPAFGKRGQFADAAQQVLVGSISPVQIHDIGDRNAMLIPFEPLYRVASSDISLCKNGKIKSGETALQESLYNIRAVEANA